MTASSITADLRCSWEGQDQNTRPTKSRTRSSNTVAIKNTSKRSNISTRHVQHCALGLPQPAPSRAAFMQEIGLDQ